MPPMRYAGARTLEVRAMVSPEVNFVPSLPDLIDPEEYAAHPGGDLVRVRIEVTDEGVVILGDALRPTTLEALLSAVDGGPVDEMLCG